MAGHQPGGPEVTAPDAGQPDPSVEGSAAPRRTTLERLLAALAAVLLVAVVVGAVFVVREHRDGERDREAQERYGAVQQAAAEEVLAMFNIDYRDPQATIEKVRAGATAEFAEEFDKASGGVVDLTAQAKSVMTAEVLWTGVVDVDPDSATVIVATTGTVVNTQTGEKPSARNFRLKLGLVREGDRWLTASLDFVQVPL